MFLKFFLSFDSFRLGGVSNNGSSGAVDVNNYRVPRELKVTFSQMMSGLRASMNRESQYLDDHYRTREILINISDDSTFQLETVAISEYCYCTYNLQTKNIGFGNTAKEALRASEDREFRSPGVSVGAGSPPKQYMLQFFSQKKEHEVMEYQCPAGFYEQILNEIKPYIQFEKRFLFKKCTDIIEREGRFLDLWFDTYFDHDAHQEIKYYGTSLHSGEFEYAVEMFMNDDPDIFNNKDAHSSGLSAMGMLCFKIMQITNETF